MTCRLLVLALASAAALAASKALPAAAETSPAAVASRTFPNRLSEPPGPKTASARPPLLRSAASGLPIQLNVLTSPEVN